MDFPWLPHWTTMVALACGATAWWLSPPEPPPKVEPDFQHKWLGVMGVILSGVILLLPLLAVGCVFLILGCIWGSWAWNVAALALLIWAGKRTWHKFWHPIG